MATTQEFVLSGTLWARLEPLLAVPVPKPHPLGWHRRQIADRDILNGIFFVLRTACPCKALDATGAGNGSLAPSRFPAWRQAGLFAQPWNEAWQDMTT